jgi:hypothetical protein
LAGEGEGSGVFEVFFFFLGGIAIDRLSSAFLDVRRDGVVGMLLRFIIFGYYNTFGCKKVAPSDISSLLRHGRFEFKSKVIEYKIKASMKYKDRKNTSVGR